ncbi:RCC1 domain-containing protein [Labilithrix luteola]|nr:RCC1 domain-containing protein [Labilithrix luteola]
MASFVGCASDTNGTESTEGTADGATNHVEASDGPESPDAADASSDVADSGGFADAGSPLTVKCTKSPCPVSLSAARGTYCALLDTGRVACWGDNSSYQLGQGADSGIQGSDVPLEVPGVEGAVAVRGTCAVLGDGVVKCWGQGNFLQANGPRPPATTNVAPSPVTLPIPPAMGISVTSDVLDNLGGCAALVSGELLCWGYFVWYSVASGPKFLDAGGTPYADYSPTISILSDGHAAVDVMVGPTSFARDERGVIWSWGAQSSLGRVSSMNLDPYPMPISIDGVTSFDASAANACAVARGQVYCWGGYDTILFATPTLIPFDVAVVSVATAPTLVSKVNPHGFACAITAKHDLYCWGDNSNGMIGNGTRTTLELVPVKVDLPGPVATVRPTSNQVCAVLENGELYCWGLGRKTTPERVVFQ